MNNKIDKIYEDKNCKESPYKIISSDLFKDIIVNLYK